MDKREKIKLVLLILGIVTCVSYLIWSSNYKKQLKEETVIELHNLFIHGMEQAYFEGQKDAINGDIHIALDSANCWYWTESPWDADSTSRRQPTFDPSNQ